MQSVTEQSITAFNKLAIQPKSQLENPFISAIYQSIQTEIQGVHQTSFDAFPLKHLILYGVTGTGKSSALSLLEAQLIEDETLQAHLSQPTLSIRLNEFEYGIRSIKDLCLRIQEHLHEQVKDVNAEALTNLNQPPVDAWEHLIHLLKRHHCSLLLLIDNLDYLLKQLDKSDYNFFVKSILGAKQEDYLIIATSQTKAVIHNTSFIKLPVLNQELAYLALIHRAQTQAHNFQLIQSLILTQDTFESIRIFTQANIQTLAHFYQASLQDPKPNGFQYLRYILQQYHGQFNDKIQLLPPQQQLIVHSLACHWHGIKVATLTQHCELASKSISAQLAQLEKQDWVEKVPSTNKNHFYRLKDSLFHLDYLIHFGANEKQKRVEKSLEILSYLTLSTAYEEESNNTQHSQATPSRSRLESDSYRTALLENQDVTTQELDSLFQHAFTFSMENEIDGQAYCEDASHYFKTHLPGERLTFLLNAASRGYEQAYLGLLSLFDMAKTPTQQALAYRVKIALCKTARTKGYAFEKSLIGIYLSQGLDKEAAFTLSQSVFLNGLDMTQIPDRQQGLILNIIALWNNRFSYDNHLLGTYFKSYDRAQKNHKEALWLTELLLMMIAKEKWPELTQIFNGKEKEDTPQTKIKDDFLLLYYGFLSFKPDRTHKEQDLLASMPVQLANAIPLLESKLAELKRKYA